MQLHRSSILDSNQLDELYYVLMCDFHVIESLHYFDKLIIINDYTKQLHHYITPLIFQNNAIVELDV